MVLWIPELTETKTQGKIADLATKRLVCLKISAKGEFSRGGAHTFKSAQLFTALI